MVFPPAFAGGYGLAGYVPPELFAGLTPGATATEMMTGVFSGTGLETECPVGTAQYITGFEEYWGRSCFVYCRMYGRCNMSDGGETDRILRRKISVEKFVGLMYTGHGTR